MNTPDHPILSIIVPVYRVEAYLPVCIESILNQEFRGYELLLIDDGSPDRCGDLCEEYALEDPRVRVIHQPNGGLSAARNTGLEQARGEYITFIDSDDALDCGTLQANMQFLLSDPSIDMLEYPIYIYYNSPQQRLWKNTPCKLCGQEEIFLYWIGRQEYRYSYICNKIYRRNLFSEIRFPIGKAFEDIRTLPLLLQKARTLYLSDQGMYCYYLRPGSITTAPTYRKLCDLLDANLYLWKQIGRYPLAEKDLTATYLYLINILIDVSDFPEREEKYINPIIEHLAKNRITPHALLTAPIPFRMKLKNLPLVCAGLKFHLRLYNRIHKMKKKR